MRLYIDIGNQRVKFAGDQYLTRAYAAVANGEKLPKAALTMGSCGRPEQIADALLAFYGPELSITEAVGCAVADTAQQHTIDKLILDHWGVNVRWISSAPDYSGDAPECLFNGYDDYEKLGADRWAAMVAARQLFPGRFMAIVDAGTATTVDIVAANGQHRGGIIFPGVQIMINALNISTGKIRTDRLDTSAIKGIPDPGITRKDTQSAVLQGGLTAVYGGVEYAVERFFTDFDDPATVAVFTGGDGRWIYNDYAARHPRRKHRLFSVPPLVLMGLQAIHHCRPGRCAEAMV